MNRAEAIMRARLALTRGESLPDLLGRLFDDGAASRNTLARQLTEHDEHVLDLLDMLDEADLDTVIGADNIVQAQRERLTVKRAAADEGTCNG